MIEKILKNGLEIDWTYVESIPEFAKLKECQQNPKWHSEGTAWDHTVKCVEAAQELLATEYQNLGETEKKTLLLSVLFHDIGKGETTEFVKENWHAYGHEMASERIARRLLWDEDFAMREAICSMARWHMEVLRVADAKDFVTKILKMACMPFFNWEAAIFVKRCDSLGSEPEDPSQGKIDEARLKFLENACLSFGCYKYSKLIGSRIRYRLFGKSIDWSNPYSPSDKPFIAVLIGLPGAGKDTLIKNYKADVEVLCRDDIRAELGFCNEGDKIIGTGDQENEVSRVFFNRFTEYVKAGKNIVLNNINLKKKYREDYHRKLNAIMGKDTHRWVYIYVEAPTLADNIERRKGQIDENVFNYIIDKFDWPTPDEYDDFFIVKQAQNFENKE